MYLQGGGIVTKQGLAAQARLNQEILKLEDELYELIVKKEGTLNLKDMTNQFKRDEETAVQIAMWRLLDKKLIEITIDRCLKATT